MSAFAHQLARLEVQLDLPYPERAMLLEELGADLESANEAHRARGLDEAAARAAAEAELLPNQVAQSGLADVHVPAIRRALARLPPPARDSFEILATAIPVGALVLYLVKEVPMLDFLRDGGFGSYVTVAIGLAGVLLCLQRIIKWFILRDHSAESLRKNTHTPMFLAAAAVTSGPLGSATGYYVVFTAWANNKIPAEAVRIGAHEALVPVILGAAFATIIILIHGLTQARMRQIRIPAA